jgi:hypothetical protein
MRRMLKFLNKTVGVARGDGIATGLRSSTRSRARTFRSMRVGRKVSREAAPF